MSSGEIEILDWWRVLIGEVPASFMIEVIIRIVVLYILLIVCLRIMGKRMSSLISRNEMIAMVSLAAAIGIPVQDPSSGLLPSIITAIVVVSVQRLISKNILYDPKLAFIVVGEAGSLLENGQLNLANMQKTRISRERLLTQVRDEGVYNLGRVERVFFEANGTFSIYLYEDEREGLCIIPDWDHDFLAEMNVVKDQYACGTCGHIVNEDNKPEDSCSHCGYERWYNAIVS